MKIKYIFSNLVCIGTLLFSSVSCSLNYDPIAQFSELTEGEEEKEDGTKNPFKNKSDIESQMALIYKQMQDRQEHWHLDFLLIAEAHSDNAYFGSTGTELAFENNSIEGSSSVLDRDWNRYLEDIGKANTLIYFVDDVNDASFTTADRERYKAQAKIFRAIVYFDMVRIWGRIPVITTVADDITSENIEEVYPQYFPEQNEEI